LAMSLVGVLASCPPGFEPGTSRFARRALYPLSYERARGQRHSTVPGGDYRLSAAAAFAVIPDRQAAYQSTIPSVYRCPTPVREDSEETTLPHPDATMI
jgi:hypothetical protein